MTTGLVTPDGRPVAVAKNAPCPKCLAGPEKRTTSSGFGDAVSILCGKCGQTLQERA